MRGSDICETNTFAGTAISQGEYKIEACVYELNKVASELCEKAPAEVTKEQPHELRPGRCHWPHQPCLSMPRSVEDCSFRNVTWDEFEDSYNEQTWGLVDGGCASLAFLAECHHC